MTKEQEIELQAIKDDCNLFAEQMISRLNDMCSSLDYINGSNLSHKIDRLELFINELNEFQEYTIA